MSDMAIDLPIRPITVSEYARRVDVGLIDADERVELLDGMLVEMPPVDWSHGMALGLAFKHLVQRLGDGFFVTSDVSIPLGLCDEPQPDIAVFHVDVLGKRRKSELRAIDIVALIEISDSSLRRDTGAKLRAYARGQVGEYVVVDVPGRRVLRYSKPRGDGFASIEELAPPATFALLAAPEAPLEVARLLPPLT
jgi:Uma2 family endonuclease